MIRVRAFSDGGMSGMREDEPVPRIGAGLHRIP
jgi:hypothetical protein